MSTCLSTVCPACNSEVFLHYCTSSNEQSSTQRVQGVVKHEAISEAQVLVVQYNITAQKKLTNMFERKRSRAHCTVKKRTNACLMCDEGFLQTTSSSCQ